MIEGKQGKILFRQDRLKNKREYFIFLIFSLCVSGLYMLIVFNKNFPVAEGWYSYYAELINEGQKPYIDFEYLFFPFYIKLIALVTRLFGYDIITLRILGVFLFLAITWISYSIFAKVFNPYIGMVSSLVTVFYLQSEIVQIFYDYIRFMDLFAYVSIYLIVLTIISMHNHESKKVYFLSISNGLIVATFIMIKQNMGLLFWLYTIGLLFFFVVLESEKRVVIHSLVIFILSSILSVILYLQMLIGIDSLKPFFELALFGSSTAKGGLLVILFEWLKTGRRYAFKKSLVQLFFPFSFFLINYLATKDSPIKISSLRYRKFGYLFFGFVFAAITSIYFNKDLGILFSEQPRIQPWLIYYPILFAMAFSFIGIAKRYFQGEPCPLITKLIFALGGSVFALGYGSGTSGGLAESQLAFGLGLIVAFTLFYSQNKFFVASNWLVLIASIFIILVTASYKMVNSYNWWGLREPSIWEAKEETSIPKLSGLLVSQNTKNILETTNRIVQKYSEKDDPIFCFPQIPVFYTLFERKDPGTFTKVQWFDVSTDKNVIKDIEVIKRVRPKVIIIQDVPQWVRTSHESIFRDSKLSGLSYMHEFLYNFCRFNGYTKLDSLVINGMNTLTIFVKEPGYNYYKNILE